MSKYYRVIRDFHFDVPIICVSLNHLTHIYKNNLSPEEFEEIIAWCATALIGDCLMYSQGWIVITPGKEYGATSKAPLPPCPGLRREGV